MGAEKNKRVAKESSNKKAILKDLMYLIIKLSVVSLLVWLSLVFVFGAYRLSGNNMYPALKDGDFCVTYKLEEYHSNDVVAYEVNGVIRFGRIIARYGDTIDGDEEGILINGSRPMEQVFYSTEIINSKLHLPYTLNEGEYILLNDYRSDTNDSREYGVITKEELHGKVIFILRRRGF